MLVTEGTNPGQDKPVETEDNGERKFVALFRRTKGRDAKPPETYQRSKARQTLSPECGIDPAWRCTRRDGASRERMRDGGLV